MWTPMYDEHRAQFTAEELDAHDAAMAQMIAIDGRLGNPSRDLVPLIIFMLGEGSRYMTGQIICVNGGMTSKRGKVASGIDRPSNGRWIGPRPDPDRPQKMHRGTVKPKRQ